MSIYGDGKRGNVLETARTQNSKSQALVDIGKASSKSHTYSRSITITLDDGNMGKIIIYFLLQALINGKY